LGEVKALAFWGCTNIYNVPWQGKTQVAYQGYQIGEKSSNLYKKKNFLCWKQLACICLLRMTGLLWKNKATYEVSLKVS